ncbi:MAG TPA: energy-coupling factor ABC transporter ATP-binding protein [Microbacteriaceae bacterium]|nr:energy-coupling factor ABC transporter ATP-binding protein [Microbacteriaceae bacterium]
MHIRFEDVSVRFGERTVLERISLDIREHRIGVIGANGSGKSTLIRLINGLVNPNEGVVSVDGVDVARNGPAVRSRVGFVFTNPDSQIVMPTVVEDVEFSLRRERLSRADRRARALDTLARVGLADRADQAAHSLSGGQKQLLALASMLALEPELLIADEPTTLLDARNARLMAQTFATLPQQLIVATHDLESLRSADRVLVVDAGRIIADGTPDTAIAAYERLVAYP